MNNMNAKYVLENSMARVVIDSARRLSWWEVLILILRLILENIDLFKRKDE